MTQKRTLKCSVPGLRFSLFSPYLSLHHIQNCENSHFDLMQSAAFEKMSEYHHSYQDDRNEEEGYPPLDAYDDDGDEFLFHEQTQQQQQQQQHHQQQQQRYHPQNYPLEALHHLQQYQAAHHIDHHQRLLHQGIQQAVQEPQHVEDVAVENAAAAPPAVSGVACTHAAMNDAHDVVTTYQPASPWTHSAATAAAASARDSAVDADAENGYRIHHDNEYHYGGHVPVGHHYDANCNYYDAGKNDAHHGMDHGHFDANGSCDATDRYHQEQDHDPNNDDYYDGSSSIHYDASDGTQENETTDCEAGNHGNYNAAACYGHSDDHYCDANNHRHHQTNGINDGSHCKAGIDADDIERIKQTSAAACAAVAVRDSNNSYGLQEYHIHDNNHNHNHNHDDADENDTSHSPKSKRQKTKTGRSAIPIFISGIIECHCRKTSCLKLYCECLNSGMLCNDGCICADCKNRKEFAGVGGERTVAIREILGRRHKSGKGRKDLDVIREKFDEETIKQAVPGCLCVDE